MCQLLPPSEAHMTLLIGHYPVWRSPRRGTAPRKSCEGHATVLRLRLISICDWLPVPRSSASSSPESSATAAVVGVRHANYGLCGKDIESSEAPVLACKTRGRKRHLQAARFPRRFVEPEQSDDLSEADAAKSYAAAVSTAAAYETWTALSSSTGVQVRGGRAVI